MKSGQHKKVVNTASDLIANAIPGVPNDWRAITALNRKYFSTTHYRPRYMYGSVRPADASLLNRQYRVLGVPIKAPAGEHTTLERP